MQLYRCKIGRSVGTSASVIGGSLTIAGGILTLTTAGAAAPLFIAGIATSSVGAATNIGTSIIEKAINSKQVLFLWLIAHFRLALLLIYIRTLCNNHAMKNNDPILY